MNVNINESGMWLMLALLAIALPVIVLASIVRLLNAFLSGSRGWTDVVAKEVWIFLRRAFVSAAVAAVLGFGWGYWKDVQLRAICDSRTQKIERSPHGGYWARYCYSGDTIVLRLYDREGERLVAERTYRDGSRLPVELHWAKEALMYPQGLEFGETSGEISLPPTFLDRMMARLP
ncbi:MAG: hypothetical protein IOC33_15890 [Burkholderia sp.]|jgi:hypothetical protein|uniref:hypothetical protein n=1 Tax=Burkholderia sp. TaxID=36773 RepID=UPI00258B567E|nr:hypothetical protein [Burkholderia sp.]MCA3640653.1 hypothetical protein [Methylobacterium sp.]MCA3799126.1 hypothetical protein [Burkholderia sp.]MCA3799263.1 hypothetical protein [Burkholderia sp.]MCA3809768.1 hypothetical protein [Burkholderia sp.]MCA3833221.1 hypothetical protein [Burkholderia sp.]